MDGERAVAAVARADETQFAALLGLGEGLLLIARPQALPIRDDPDLQEANRIRPACVVFAVAHARAGGHALHVARPDHRLLAGAVLVLEGALERIGDDLHVAVGVGWKSPARRHAVLVGHCQGN
jgi:hypothetical protein